MAWTQRGMSPAVVRKRVSLQVGELGRFRFAGVQSRGSLLTRQHRRS